MEWLDKYLIGEETIDRQHQEIFRAVNRIIQIVDEKDTERNQRVCIEGIKYLKNYTINHFRDEEDYQRRIGYEGYEHHKRIHDEFRMVILWWEDYMAEQGFSRDAVMEFVQLLTGWLVTHIMKEDQAITPGEPEGEEPIPSTKETDL